MSRCGVPCRPDAYTPRLHFKTFHNNSLRRPYMPSAKDPAAHTCKAGLCMTPRPPHQPQAHPLLPVSTHCTALSSTSSSTPASAAGSSSTYSLSADASCSLSSCWPVPLLPPRTLMLMLLSDTCKQQGFDVSLILIQDGAGLSHVCKPDSKMHRACIPGIRCWIGH